MSQVPVDVRLRSGALEAGVDLDPSQVQQLIQYLVHLERWNRTINLTALSLAGYPSSTLDRLVFEPLRSRRAFRPGDFQWVDLGSGGGSPAIPLKIVLPDTALTMVESRSRKAAFLRHVVRVLGLADVRVLWERVEALDHLVGSASIDVLTVRALRIDAGVAVAVRRMVNDSGRVVLFGTVDASPLLSQFDSIDVGVGGDITVLTRQTHADVPRGT